VAIRPHFNTAGGAGNFDLTNSGGTFNVFENPDVRWDAHCGTVVPTGASAIR
jgi:hypothetical protein